MTAQFRIGGHYRDGNGNLCAVLQHAVPGRIAVRFVDESDGEIVGLPFDHFAATGEYLNCEGKPTATDRFNLLPGELHNVNGQWVPVAEEAPKTEEALLAEIAPNDSSMDVMRPALTWATPKPVDRWEGYAVKRGAVKHDEYNPPARTEHVLQRMTDPSDPLHGSAFLKVS